MSLKKKISAGVWGSLKPLRTENFKDIHLSLSLIKQCIIRAQVEGAYHV